MRLSSTKQANGQAFFLGAEKLITERTPALFLIHVTSFFKKRHT
jgi:hypothetical protein